MSSEWSSDFTLRFLTAYFSEPMIWDPRDPRHKDRQEVATAWSRVESALDHRASVAELKRKRENLMSTYRKLHNKVRASRSGGEEFRPDWFAYDLMATHLDEVYCPKVQPFKAEEPCEDTTSEYDLGESMPSEEDLKEMEAALSAEVVLGEGGGGGSLCRGGGGGQQRSASGGRKRKNLLIDMRSQATQQDEVSLFLDLLDLKLRSLGGGLRELAMNQIDNLVHHLRIQQNLPWAMPYPPHPGAASSSTKGGMSGPSAAATK